jgi:hypothetical protein
VLLLEHLKLVLDIVANKLTGWTFFAQGNTFTNNVQRNVLCVECSLDIIMLTEERLVILVDLLGVLGQIESEALKVIQLALEGRVRAFEALLLDLIGVRLCPIALSTDAGSIALLVARTADGMMR